MFVVVLLMLLVVCGGSGDSLFIGSVMFVVSVVFVGIKVMLVVLEMIDLYINVLLYDYFKFVVDNLFGFECVVMFIN